MPPKDLKGQTKKYDEVVSALKREGKVSNPYAVATTTLRRMKKRSMKSRRK